MSKIEKIGSKTRNRQSRRATFGLGILKVACLTFLVQSPLFATDPTEIDPDPDYASFSTESSKATTLVVFDLDSLDIAGLPPGRYLVVVIDENQGVRRFEIHVR